MTIKLFIRIFRKFFQKNGVNKKNDQLEKLIFDEGDQKRDDGFEFESFHLDSAFSGEEGIQLVKQSLENKNPYAVAIVDVRMPGGLDGVQTVEKIFKIEKSIQIIFCTAYADYNWEEMLTLLDHSDRWVILKKPFDVIEVRQMALSLCYKWVLLSDLRTQISRQTKDLKEKIEDLKKTKQKVRHLAYYDALTELPNRLFFTELLKQCIVEADRNKTIVCLFFLDIDDFKKVNDTYGHAAGDELLKQVAERLNTSLRKSDRISRYGEKPNKQLTISRLGGDEFTIILRNFGDHRDILSVSKRILKFISYPVYHLKWS